ncbi:MAG: GGDEF domain-containing protein [Longicatena sp.]
MKKTRRNLRPNTIARSAIIGFFCLCALLGVATIYMNLLNKNITDDIKKNLNEVSEKNANAIRVGMEDNLTLLNSFAEYLQFEDLSNKEVIVDKLVEVVKKNDFKRMAIADLNGDCYTTDGVHTNISEREYYQKAIKGESNISSILNDYIGDGSKINAYASPLYQNGDVQGVAVIVKETKEVAETLLVKSFDGEGISFLVDNNSEIVLRSDDKKELDIHNIEQLKFRDGAQQYKDKNTSGVLPFTLGNKEYYMAFEPLKINDWYVISIVPSSVIASEIASFTSMAVLTWIAIIAVFMVLLWYIYIIWQRHNRRLEAVLYKDALTGYANFNQFKVDVAKCLSNTNEQYGSLIEFDIDDFKMFNKFYGYANGDELLKAIMRVANLYCGKDEYCARISDDRFVMYWSDSDVEAITRRINAMYSNAITVFESDHIGMNFQLCFGIFVLDEEHHHLMKSLDKAIYAKNFIKNKSGNYISFYNEEMYQQILRIRRIEERMETALENGEFIVYLQPKVDVITEQIVAAEALVRWLTPEGKLISPGEFIPLFERNGFLEKLDLYVFEVVCKTLNHWQKENKKMITISVNVSKSYIFSEGFAKRLYSVAKAKQVETKYLELEITENTMIENLDELITVINELKSYGFKVSMDDFGSGYSSLNMLKDVPIDIIKLDQVFFKGSDKNKEKSNFIVEGLLRMVDLLHIDTVAEGIETLEQLKFLQRVHCHIAQGFYFYHPMPIIELEKILNRKD